MVAFPRVWFWFGFGFLFSFLLGSVFIFLLFLFLSGHILQTEYSLPQVYWIKSIATKENDPHFCFHDTSQLLSYSFCFGAHGVGNGEKGGSGEGLLGSLTVGLSSGSQLSPRELLATRVRRSPGF